MADPHAAHAPPQPGIDHGDADMIGHGTPLSRRRMVIALTFDTGPISLPVDEYHRVVAGPRRRAGRVVVHRRHPDCRARRGGPLPARPDPGGIPLQLLLCECGAGSGRPRPGVSGADARRSRTAGRAYSDIATIKISRRNGKIGATREIRQPNRRVGSGEPREDTMGYLRGVVHGMIIGGAVALLYAPKPGPVMRADPSQRLDPVPGQMQPVLDPAPGVVDSARPQVERGISKAQQQAQKITKRGSDSGGGSATAYGGSAGTGSGSAPSPGV